MCTQKWWTLAVGHDVHKKRCSEALDHPRAEAPPLPGSQPITVHFCTVSSVINILFLFRQWLDQMLTKQSKLDNILRKTLTILVLWMRNIFISALRGKFDELTNLKSSMFVYITTIFAFFSEHPVWYNLFRAAKEVVCHFSMPRVLF